MRLMYCSLLEGLNGAQGLCVVVMRGRREIT